MKGIDCKDLGDNFFLFTFGQAAGKQKALEEGPWMVSHELLVVANFDGSKTLDEIEFASIPIWVRVANLPMGLMNRSTAQAIGDEVGKFLEMEDEAEPDEIVAGRVLRLKVRLDIHKPLMGVSQSLWVMDMQIDGAPSLMSSCLNSVIAVASLDTRIELAR